MTFSGQVIARSAKGFFHVKGQQVALDQIAALPSLPLPELRELWRTHFNRDPFSTHRPVLIPCLAYRIQERIFGGLSKSARAQLAEIADDISAGRKPSFVAVPVSNQVPA